MDYSVNNWGQAELEIEGEAGKYYLLKALHEPNLTYESITSMTLGVDGPMVISESLGAFPELNYTITEHSISEPDDTDGDGIDDVTEFNNMPTQAPLNFAPQVPFNDGLTSLKTAEDFDAMSLVTESVSWAPFLNDQQFTKFIIYFFETEEPRVYFINSETHFIHAQFTSSIGMTGVEDVSGEIVYNPNTINPNGVFGTYSFNFSFGDAYDFEHTQRTFELLAANMPFLQNNFRHFIGNGGENNHVNLYADEFVGSRITVVLESEFFADVDYLPFNQAEGYGFFRHMSLDENPGSRDIVLYDALPNSLPRVGGIITSVIQTPLSHVNLRAIQDNVPNAYIKNPLEIPQIANLLGNYVYYRVEADHYVFEEASLEEVNAWYENIRPTEEQIPDRDLTQTEILPLDEIGFDMANAFGAKCANVATMRSFDLPEGTIPDGFGIPFYYYDEFMKFNGFYEQVEEMIGNPDFISDLETRIAMLKDFRTLIKEADMPQWMLADLQLMHDSFPEGTNVRCRSSTNNEDLPGFSGAGLYTSKTQYLEEGHISKSVKQVYASMWNFRAFDERDFYRVDHYIAAMGILCHPNFQEEESNGVGISIDPIFNTVNTFYLNTQLGESLVTNPDENSIPEEILLNQDPEEGYFVLRYSNLVGEEELVMDELYLDQMRDYLGVIHDEFAELYDVVGAEGFGMDIEYKVTAEDQLVIKQARPWVSFWSEIKADYDLAAVKLIDPESSATLGANELITVEIANKGLKPMVDFDVSLFINEELVETITVQDTLRHFFSEEYQFTTPQDFSAIGEYNIMAIVSDPLDGYTRNDTLNEVLNQLHALEGGLVAQLEQVRCGETVDVSANISNWGATTFNEVEIEVIVNGVTVDIVSYDSSIPYSVEVSLPITVTENLMPTGNEITLNLLSVNGMPDAIMDNNSSSIFTDLDNNFDFVTLIIDPDDYPEETSWEIIDEMTNQVVASASLSGGISFYSEEICVNYNSCFSLIVRDSYGDGICCGFGQGSFSMVNSFGETLLFNDASWDHNATEFFCPDPGECILTAEIATETVSTTSSGSISISAFDGIEPYQYSIDGGNHFTSNSLFSNVAAGLYNVAVVDLTGDCFFETTVEVKECSVAAEVNTTIASNADEMDGTLSIYVTSGNAPFQYSIDGGLNFGNDSSFDDLAPGNYHVVVMEPSSECIYEINVELGVCELQAEVSTVNASISTEMDGSLSIEVTEGQAPFVYSIDGGENFGDLAIFNNLAPGTYDVVIQDATEFCVFESAIELGFDVLSGINQLALGNIKLYPNPVKENLIIAFDDNNLAIPENLQLEIFNSTGQLMERIETIELKNKRQIGIGMQEYSPGSYTIRLFTNGYQRSFHLVKI